MPAKKTFASIRVRGPAEFNQVPTIQGIPLNEFVGSGGSAFAVYTALLSQAGTDAPAATVLQNTLAGAPVWSRVSGGVYRATLAGAFPAGKVVVLLAPLPDLLSLGRLVYFYGVRLDDDTVEIKTGYFNPDSGALPKTDALLSETAIEFRVYP
jgi:hypothetical protein